MRILSRKKLREFWERIPDSEEALKAWFHEVKAAEWAHSAAVKEMYRSASIIRADLVVFNICGNKYRLVVRINYRFHMVYIRFVGTHKEYDRIKVEAV